MKKTIIRGLNILILIAIFGGIGWIFREKLEVWVTDMTSPSPSQIERQGVPRRISYLGRLREAQRLMEHEYFSLATIELSAAIAEKPHLSQPYFLLGEVYLRSGQMQKLSQLIAQLRQKFPNHPDIAILEARQHIFKRDFVSALAMLETHKEALSPGLKLYQAIVLALQNDHARAQEILETLSRLPKREAELTVTAEGVTEVSAPLQSLSPALAEKVEALLGVYETFDEFADGKNPHLFALMAKVLAEHHEAILAQEFAEVAIKEDIGYIDAWILRGYAFFLQQKYESALEDFRHAYEMDPLRPQTQYFLALSLEKTGNDTEAAIFFEKALQHDFEFSSEVRWKLIEILSAQQKFDRVLDLYTDLVEEDPEPKKYVSAIYTSIDVIQRPAIALNIAEKLLAENPDDLLAMNLYGWALIANKQFVAAEEVLQKAKTLDPEQPRTFLNLGLLREKQGKYIEAAEWYKQAYELGEGKPFDSVINLAAEKYNALIQQINQPGKPPAPAVPASSP
ncbi:MAG: tetratricopeptide repeat protein [Candidatus Gracilibacteria bacterium]|nr:tetratricopeptide repeat protein [Candidatus Gracilibacteria bacterium]